MYSELTTYPCIMCMYLICCIRMYLKNLLCMYRHMIHTSGAAKAASFTAREEARNTSPFSYVNIHTVVCTQNCY